MYINVSFIDLSKTIYVQRHLWEKSVTLEFALNYMTKSWSEGKIMVNGLPITEQDLKRELSTFNTKRTILGEYELQIEKHK